MGRKERMRERERERMREREANEREEKGVRHGEVLVPKLSSLKIFRIFRFV